MENLEQKLAGDGRYVLEVRDDKMIDANIWDGNFVVADANKAAKSGDIVIALINNDEAVLRRFYKLDDRRVLLMCENKFFKPDIFSSNDIAIQGVVVGVFSYPK